MRKGNGNGVGGDGARGGDRQHLATGVCRGDRRGWAVNQLSRVDRGGRDD